MRKLLLVLTLAFLFVLQINSAPCEASSAADVVRVAFTTDARTIDPGSATRDYTGYAAISGIYDGLVAYPRNLTKDGAYSVDTTKVEPMLAESWEHNADMSEWTFKIRKNAKFHSGEPVNAHAVKYTFSRYIKIKSAAKTVLWLAKVTEEGMTVVDDHTIKFKLTAPNPLFLDYLQMLNLGIQDPKAIEANGGVVEGKVNEWAAKNDAGSGPFKLKAWKPGVEIVLERNEDYWGEKPKTKQMVFKIVPEEATREMLLERGIIDIMWWIPAKDYEMLTQKSNIKVIARTTTKVNYIDMNRDKEPFNNPKLRKALAYSFPYEAVIKEVLYGRAIQMTSPASDGSPSHTNEFFKYEQNLGKAKKLLMEAGYPNGLDLKFQLGEGRIANNREIAVTWQAELKKIGVNMEIEVLPQAAFLENLKAKKVPFFMIGWTSFVTDPWYQFTFLLGSKSFCNYAEIKDEQLDAWIDEAAVLVDKPARYELSKKVQQHVAESDLWIYMFQPISDTAMNKKVQGFCLSPDDQFHIRTVYKEK